MSSKIPNVLSIAGSDPSGGAGVQADLKTFAALGCYGMAVVTSLTAQNTKGVKSVIDVPARFVEDQISTLFEDIEIDAVKIGMVVNSKIIDVIANLIEKYQPENIVFDPVMVASSGNSLIDIDAISKMKERLIPLCNVLTPNIPETEKLLRKSVIDMQRSAMDLLTLGSKSVYLKGGHLSGDIMQDVLAYGDNIKIYETDRICTNNTHGTGCTLSSAIAAYLALGNDLADSSRLAKQYLYGALESANKLNVGYGAGPLHHGYCLGGDNE